MKALIHNDQIVDVHPVGFPVAPELQWVDCPDDCTTQWVYLNGACQPKPRDFAAEKAAMPAKIEAWRDQACVANVTAHGRPWQADKTSQALLGQAIALAQAGLPLPAVWRDANNNNMPITSLADLLAIAGAIAAQVQAAYVRSWQLKAQVEAATTVEELDAIQW